MFPGVANGDEISLYELDIKTKTFFYVKIVGKYQISTSRWCANASLPAPSYAHACI